jgi:hypothetical protein
MAQMLSVNVGLPPNERQYCGRISRMRATNGEGIVNFAALQADRTPCDVVRTSPALRTV